jgi:hypothetical protein
MRKYWVDVHADTTTQKQRITMVVGAATAQDALALVGQHEVMGEAVARLGAERGTARESVYAEITGATFVTGRVVVSVLDVTDSTVGGVEVGVRRLTDVTEELHTGARREKGWLVEQWLTEYVVERRGAAAGTYVGGQEVLDVVLLLHGMAAEEGEEREERWVELFVTVRKVVVEEGYAATQAVEEGEQEDEGADASMDDEHEIEVESEEGEEWACGLLERLTGLAADGWSVQMEGDDYEDYADAVTLVWSVYGHNSGEGVLTTWLQEHGTTKQV